MTTPAAVADAVWRCNRPGGSLIGRSHFDPSAAPVSVKMTGHCSVGGLGGCSAGQSSGAPAAATGGRRPAAAAAGPTSARRERWAHVPRPCCPALTSLHDRRRQGCRQTAFSGLPRDSEEGSSATAEEGVCRGESALGVPLLTFAETVEIAKERGLHLYCSELGPFYRIVVRDGAENGEILGLTTGFIAPWFGLMHLDTLQIFNSKMKKGSDTRQRAWGSPRGLGLLIGCATFAYGHEAGCKKAELLAINDSEAWAKRLVRYYGHFGFKVRYEVGDRGLADLPDMLVWGGAGTRMDAEVEPMLRRWSSSIRPK